MKQNILGKILANLSTIGLSLVIIAYPTLVFAQASSPNYRLEEPYFGTGGEVDASSNSYRARQQAGSLGVGNTSSTNYDAISGGVTPSEPYLEMTVSGATVDFGVLQTSTPSFGAAQGGACNCSFTVRTYLSSQYTVINASLPPKNESGKYMQAKSTLGTPSVNDSDEEFGMNLTTNTSPGTMGANPVNVPDNSFADGKIESGYNTSNQYKFNTGDVIARSPNTIGNQAVGQTNYTISYIAKAGSTSAAGTYRLDHVLVVVPVF